MSQILLDSYFMIGLHQERFKEINVYRLNNLLYLAEAYYMCLNDTDKLYNEAFNVSVYGVYVKELMEFFGKELNGILINDIQIKMGKEIEDKRKEILYEIYKMYSKMSDWTIREIILSDDSPAGVIFSNPYSLYYSYVNPLNVKINKEDVKEWFKRNYLK